MARTGCPLVIIADAGLFMTLYKLKMTTMILYGGDCSSMWRILAKLLLVSSYEDLGNLSLISN